jgi:3-methylcrotonyl-CoA carboxylase alpha subunit
MFKRLLIANRGEIACRIMRTAKQMSLTCIAIYSDADRKAQHVLQADEAYWIGPSPSKDSYLHIANILELAKKVGVDAIHPGYGFLAENADFAAACEQAGICFIGPSSNAMRLMGSKDTAKTLMAKASIPLLPGYYGKVQDVNTLQAAAERIGYPVLLKAVAGGGGKGMRIVNSSMEFAEQLASARREAKASFGNDSMLVEKFLSHARHIEVQVFADKQGQTIHLWDRDCSIQRRYQKIIEEAPAPDIAAELRQAMHMAAIQVAKTIAYIGAGTVEFLLQDGQFYFMEMNTRLQVEHPITEMITGYDLVAWQLKIAAGEPLPVQQGEVRVQGHAIEARICAENAQQDFMPSAGTIHLLQEPLKSQALRIDTGIVVGDTVSSYYDSLLAKLIVHAAERQQAIQALRQALAATEIAGVYTNLPLLRGIAALPAFSQSSWDTQFIPVHHTSLIDNIQAIDSSHWLAASLYFVLHNQAKAGFSPWDNYDGWRMNISPYKQTLLLKCQQQQGAISISHQTQGYSMVLGEKTWQVSGAIQHTRLLCDIDGRHYTFTIAPIMQQLHLLSQDRYLVFEPYQPQVLQQEMGEHSLLAPLPGSITAILVQKGQRVEKGQALLAIEAMKMEHVVRAPYVGTVEHINFTIGEQVAEGSQLVQLIECP